MNLINVKNPHLCPVCGIAEKVVTQIMSLIIGSSFKVLHRPIPKIELLI